MPLHVCPWDDTLHPLPGCKKSHSDNTSNRHAQRKNTVRKHSIDVKGDHGASLRVITHEPPYVLAISDDLLQRAVLFITSKVNHGILQPCRHASSKGNLSHQPGVQIGHPLVQSSLC